MSRLPWYLVVILVVLLILQRECGSSCTPCANGTDTVKVTVTVYDSIPVTATFTKPSLKSSTFRQPTKPITTPAGVTNTTQPVDNRACVQELFTARFYEQHYRDSLIEAVLRDSVWANQLTWSQLEYKILRPTVVSSTIITPTAPQRAKLFVGLSASAGVSPAAGPELLYLTKADNGYKAAVKLGPLGINYEAGMYWKIKLRK